MSWIRILDEPFFRRVAVALLQFLWQGAAIAAVYAAADGLLRARRARASSRYAVACAALAVMVLVPVATFLRAGSPGAASAGASSGPSAGGASAAQPSTLETAGETPAAIVSSIRGLLERAGALRPLWMSAWLAGVVLLSVRLLLGWAVAQRLTRRFAIPARAELAAAVARLSRRLSVSRPVRLLESAAVRVPIAVGTLRPVILLPISAVTGLDPGQLEAVIAHELAHIRRNDYAINLLQSAAETLLFFHPAVWWISSRVRAERENCCDDLAVEVTGDARLYAGALVDLEERRGGRRALVLAADGGDLFHRIARLFPSAAPVSHTRRMAGSLALAALLLTGAAFRISSAAPAGPVSLGARAEAPCPEDIRASAKPVRARSIARSVAPEIAAAVAPELAAAAAEAAEEASADADATEAASEEDTVVVSATPADPETGAASGLLTPAELTSLATHGVTAEFVARIRALGYSRALVDELVSLRVHGVSPDEIAAFQKKFGKVSLEQSVELTIHGVTPAWLDGITAAGIARPSVDQALAMRIHGVTPEFLRSFREAGFASIDADRAVALRIHGVEPAFAREMRSLGFTDAGLEELTSFRIHGVTAAFVRDVRAAGLEKLSADDATSLRIHGVTPEFVREMRSLGVALGCSDDATSLRIHGVTTDFVRSIESLGYSKPTVDDLTSLRIHGLTPDRIREINRAAGRRLPLDDVVDEWLERRSE